MGNVRIPEEIVEEIRNAIDIVDVVGEYISLKKQGRNLFGLCPFHGEKTPSFSVSPDKQIFHCFGCKAGGNVFSFLMEMEGWSFLETVHYLGEKAGFDLSAYDKKHAATTTKENETREIIAIHELMAKLYHHCLTKMSQGQKALQYLKKRGMTDEVIEKFQLGYAPNSWDFATTFLERRGYSLEQAEKGGVISKRQFDGKYFDRFRDRIIFPIHNLKGDAIGFGGRIVQHGEPKYLNSPESAIFHKSKILYGFHLARANIRKKRQAVLFEGYVDVISAWQAGVDFSVAGLGTSFTEEQAKLLRRNAESVVICYDADHAGINAALQAAALLEKAGCYVKIAELPAGLDPDEYIQTYGKERFRSNVILGAGTVMAFKMNVLRRGKNLQDEGERLRYLEEVLQEISRLPKAVERDHYLRQLADEFSLSLEALKQQQFQYYLRMKNKQHKGDKEREANAEKMFRSKRLLPAHENAERILLALMMKNKKAAAQIQEQIGGDFHKEEHRALAAHIYAYYAEGHSANPSALLATIDEQRLLTIASELSMISFNEKMAASELQDYIHTVQNYPKWLRIKEKEREKTEAERNEDFLLAAKIATEVLEMKKALKINNR